MGSEQCELTIAGIGFGKDLWHVSRAVKLSKYNPQKRN